MNSNLNTHSICPCGTGKIYENCCKILHDGAYPKNALDLMRSRYSAYAYHLVDYIIKTTHTENPHYQKNRKDWIQEIEYFCQNTQFKKLEILNFTDGSEEAFVTFVAHLAQDNSNRILKEKSHFVKIGKQWLYLNGMIN